MLESEFLQQEKRNTIKGGIQQAKEIIDSGAAFEKLRP